MQNFLLTFLNSKNSVKGIFLRSDIQQCIETNRCKKCHVSYAHKSRECSILETKSFWEYTFTSRHNNGYKKIRQSELQDDNKGLQTVTHSTCDAYLHNSTFKYLLVLVWQPADHMCLALKLIHLSLLCNRGEFIYAYFITLLLGCTLHITWT